MKLIKFPPPASRSILRSIQAQRTISDKVVDVLSGDVPMEQPESSSGKVTGFNFSVLAYVPKSSNLESPKLEAVILLVFQDDDYVLRFLVHHDLKEIVAACDFSIVISLLRDFLERDETSPVDFFVSFAS
jgi:hypothetical protein